MSDTPKSQLGIFSGTSNEVFRRAIMLHKMVKRIAKGKEASNPFLKTVKIFCSKAETADEKMILDTGCEAHNLITYQVINDMSLAKNIILSPAPICICLNGETLISMGTITLRWKGRGFRKIFETTFYVIEDDDLPWQVILGAETIRKESILKFMGFGGRTMLPKKTKDEKAKAAQRRREHEEAVATNAADIAANEMAKQSAPSWSNWEWDESRQLYYRARLVGDAWQYQYSNSPA